uniref:Uncharacterized protein n=1 Tax=Anopheles christyi TaxID=43041 RepID=A0A182KG11_9DIPT
MCTDDEPCRPIDVRVSVSFKRTLRTLSAPGKKHSRSYPHHHHYTPRDDRRRYRVPSVVIQFLSKFLLFLVICDSQTVSRAAFRASAATIPPSPGADVYTDSIISSGGGGGGGDEDGGGAAVQPTSGAPINHTKLQEIVLEGLGLSALPDVRMVSVA